MGFPGGSGAKNLPANRADTSLIPGLGRFPWRRSWQPTPVFLLGKSHGLRRLAGYSQWGHKESEMTDHALCVCVCVCVCVLGVRVHHSTWWGGARSGEPPGAQTNLDIEQGPRVWLFWKCPLDHPFRPPTPRVPPPCWDVSSLPSLGASKCVFSTWPSSLPHMLPESPLAFPFGVRIMLLIAQCCRARLRMRKG